MARAGKVRPVHLPGASRRVDARRNPFVSMTRLGTYLFRLFAAEAAALFGVALTILYLVQLLRIVEVGALRDRGLGTLFWQTILGLPPLSIAFLYVCLAIGLARALRAMQGSRELHIIHVSQRLPVLLGTILGYAVVGTLLVWLLAHVIEPIASRENNQIKAQAAADLVGRSLVPNRFAELGDGVTITVGGRGADGQITSFFADDRRDAGTRRTYIADSAVITADELGFVLQLEDGTIQYRTADGQFSEISFERYDIALERLTGDEDTGDRRGDQTTWGMITRAMASGDFPMAWQRGIAERTADGLRVLALCLFVAAISAFPSGRRREPLLPVEISVLGAVLFERAVTSYARVEGWANQLTGVVVLIVIAVVMLVYRLRLFAPLPREAHSR